LNARMRAALSPVIAELPATPCAFDPEFLDDLP
jgi:hypothetical protein